MQTNKPNRKYSKRKRKKKEEVYSSKEEEVKNLIILGIGYLHI